MSLLSWLDKTISENKDKIASITVEIEEANKPLTFCNISEVKVDLTAKVLVHEHAPADITYYGGFYGGVTPSTTPPKVDTYPESTIRGISILYKVNP
jgi:hypothetical protein